MSELKDKTDGIVAGCTSTGMSWYAAQQVLREVLRQQDVIMLDPKKAIRIRRIVKPGK